MVRLVLFQPDSMKYEENTLVENAKITEKRIIDQHKLAMQHIRSYSYFVAI